MKFSKVFLLLAASMLFLSCAAGTKQVKKQTITFLEFLPAQSPITKSGITLTVTPVSASDPRFLFTYTVVKKGILGEYTDKQKECIFGNACTFELEIQNNTGHVIRLANTIVQLATASGKSIDPMTPTYVSQFWAAKVPNLAPPTPSYISSLGLLDFGSAAILPGKSVKGVLAFPGEMKGIGSGTLVIYDIVTKVDAAGNPTEKSNFDFNFKEVTTEIVK